MDEKKLTKAIALPKRLGEIIEPPSVFFERPYTNDYFDTINAMLLDPHIYSQLQLRKYAVLSCDISFEGDKRAVEVVKEAIANINLQKDLYDLLSALEYGYCVCEVVWKKENIWKISSIERRDPLLFRFNNKNELVYADRKPVEDRKFLYLAYNSTHENPYGESILKPVYYVWKLKQLALNYWEIAMEKFAIPPLIGRLSESSSEEDIRNLEEIMAKIESSAGVVVSGVEEIKPLEIGDKADVFKELIEFCNKEISKAITGQYLGSEIGDSGSYALAKVHKDMFLYVVRSDAKLLEHKLNISLIPWILELNSVKGECSINLSLKEDIELDKLLELLDKGFPVSMSAVYERYGVPKPESKEDVFVKQDMGISFSDKLNFSLGNYQEIFEGL